MYDEYNLLNYLTKAESCHINWNLLALNFAHLYNGL